MSPSSSFPALLGPDPALKCPGGQLGEASLGCGSNLRCTTGRNRIFGFSAPRWRQTLSLSLSPACREMLAARRAGAGLEGAGRVAMGCSDAPVPPGEEIWVISSWLLVSPCPAWAPEGSRHWLLPTAAAPGLETLLLLGALVSCFAFPEVLEPKPPGWYLGSPACTDWCSRTTPSYCGWVALGAAGSDGCNGLKLVQRAQVEPQATKKYPWRCCGLSVFLQLSPGVGYFGSSGGTCLKARPPPPPPTGPRSPAAPAPQLEFPGAPPPARSPPLLEKLLSLEVEGGLGGKTLPPVRDLLQMPFAESFKTESDQLRLANERPDGRGGGLGEKEPCGLRQQVVLEPGWDLSSWQSPCPPPSSSLRRNCWCPLEGG